MRPNAVIASVVLFSAICAGGLYYRYTGTPEYSLLQLTTAIRAKDYETARYYVDEERLADNISKSVVDSALAKVQTDMRRDLADNPFAGLGEAFIQMMVPRLNEIVHSQVQDSIRQALSGNEVLTSESKAKTADLKTFSQIKVARSFVAGNTAEVVLTGFPQPNPFEVTEFRFRMARIPDTRRWRIVEAPGVECWHVREPAGSRSRSMVCPYEANEESTGQFTYVSRTSGTPRS